MCVNKVFVGDLINGVRSKSRGSYFACGQCPACQQSRANRRAVRIRNHHPRGFIAYFVTLTYHNDYIPYVSKSDIIDAYNELRNTGCNGALIPVYRDYDYKALFAKAEKLPVQGSIGTVFVKNDKRLTYDELEKLSGIRKKVSSFPPRFVSHPDKVSIAYTPDIQNFIKRFRENYFRTYKKRLKMSYYSAPEYGPTSQRFHVHLLLWLPSEISEVEAFNMCRQAWPYEDLYNSTFCQVARDPSNYIASYVNCDANVSLFLRVWFPLRPAHSLEFGFSSSDFELSEIIGHSFETRRFKYTYLTKSPDGVYIENSSFYPSYVIYRYFPKLKGFRNIPRQALFESLVNPYKYLALGTTKVATASNGEPLYRSGVRDFNGNYLLYTEKEIAYFLTRLYKTYCKYYIPLEINWYDYIEIIIDYHIRRPLEMYKDSQADDSPTLTTRRFFNLNDVKTGKVRNYTIAKHIRGDIPEVFNCNTLPEEVNNSIKLQKQFYQNVKTRKIGEFA